MNEAANHYVRIEGMNLDAFIFDTRNLSVIRGASLLLLGAEKKILGWLNAQRPRVLSKGASALLVEVTTADPASLVKSLRDHLRADDQLKHATFTIATCPVKEPFRDCVEELIAANRWEQMQSASLSLPALNQDRASGICALNGILPGGAKVEIAREQTNVNQSTAIRFRAGRKAKQDFYDRFGVPALPDFAVDFDAIATGTKNLNGKLAVFYADGNQFGKIQTSCCTKPVLQALWDSHIRASRDAFMEDFLGAIAADPSWRCMGQDARLRFETLLWGGDELLFVMPAEKGWSFAQRFFAHFEKWKALHKANASLLAKEGWSEEELADAKFPETAPRLTYTASLVFCHHHAPIARIKHLAKDQMADGFAKDKSRDRDQLVVQVLESFDHLGGDYAGALGKRYGAGIDLADLILAASPEVLLSKRLDEIGASLAALRDSAAFPRNQLRKVVVGITRAKKMKDLPTALADHFPEVEAGSAERNAIDTVQKMIQPPNACWVQMEELWDYARP